MATPPAMQGLVFDPHVTQAMGWLLFALIIAVVALALGEPRRRR